MRQQSIRLITLILCCMLLTGCPALGWLVRAGAGRASTQVAAGELVIGRAGSSALATAAARSGISVTQALAMRGAAAGLVHRSPVRLAAGELIGVDVYEGSAIVLRGTLARKGNVATLSDGAGGEIRATLRADGAIEIVDQSGKRLGSAVVDGAEVNLVAADGTTSLGRDVLLPEENQIKHLDQAGRIVAITELKMVGQGAQRRLVLRLARELVKDLRLDLQQESRYADTAPSPQKPTGLVLEPISLSRRGNFGLLQTNIYWTAQFKLTNQSAEPIGVSLLEAVVAPIDCHTGRGMYVSRASGIHWVDNISAYDTNPLDMTTIEAGRTIRVNVEIVCDSFARSLYPMIESPLTVEILVDEAGQRRVLGLGVAAVPLGGRGAQAKKSVSQQSGPLRMTAVYATSRSQSAILQGSISWHLVMRIDNTVNETLFLTVNELTVDSVDCTRGGPMLTDEWGFGRIDPQTPTKPSDLTRASMLSLPAFSSSQVAVEFTCTSNVRNMTPQMAISLYGTLKMERHRKFERISVSIDNIPIGIGGALDPAQRP